MAVFKNGIFARYNGEIITPQSLGIDYTGIEKCKQFFNSGSISDEVQQYAVYRLVGDLQTYGIWDKTYTIYPIVGGTAEAHKFNLKDPRDLDEAHRITFEGTWTHTNQGMIANTGTSNYGNTHFSQSLISSTDGEIGYYSRTNTGTNTGVDFGDYTSPGSYSLLIKYNGGFYGRAATQDINFVSNPGTRGLFSIQSYDTNKQRFIYRGVFTEEATATTTGTSNSNVLIGTGRYGSVKTQCAFAYTSQALNESEAANLYTAVQRFQTTLGRQV